MLCFLLGPGRPGSLLRVDILDIFTLVDGAFVRAQTTLGKLVNSLIGTAPSRLDHVENAALVGGQSHHFAGNFTRQRHTLAESLRYNNKR